LKVFFTDRAEADLRDIAMFIARDNPATARTFARELRSRAKAIADMPRAFPLLPHYELLGLRRRPHRDYLIFYRIDPDKIVIIHILHAARDYEAVAFFSE
jgi:plasmid stabilization system protein ParE